MDGSFELGRLRIAALYEGGRAGGWIGGLVVDDALEEREGWCTCGGDERAEDEKEEIEDVKDEFDVIRILWMSGSSE